MFLKDQIKKRIKNEKGLILIELLAVIVILAIIAAIAIPAIGNIIDNSRYKAVKSDALNVLNAAQIYYSENPTDTTGALVTSTTPGDLKTNGFLEDFGKIPDDATIAKDSDGNELTTVVIDYGGKNKIKFTDAKIADINSHSDKTETTIGTQPTTP